MEIKKLKVMTVVGTRPEIIRLSCVIDRLDASPAIEHILVHTGQNYDYELNEVFFKDLDIRKPDCFLDTATGNPIETIGNILIKIDPILEKEKPEAFLILGDTNSCLCAIAAKRRKIPIFHMEAGNRCFDQRVPEETNRKIVDHISDINMPYSSIAREYLLKEGVPADRIIKTGSPMYEVLHSKINKIINSDILTRLKLDKDNYFLVSAHREENINDDQNFFDLLESLNAIAEIYQLPIIFSTHPRTRKRIEAIQQSTSNHSLLATNSFLIHPNITFLKPLGFIDYNHLQLNAKCVLSDSGTISEETSILGLKSLNIRQAHERPEAMEEGTVMMVGLQKERILQALSILDSNQPNNPPNQLSNQPTNTPSTPRLVYDYSMPNVSDKILHIIISYVNYVNTVVWCR